MSCFDALKSPFKKHPSRVKYYRDGKQELHPIPLLLSHHLIQRIVAYHFAHGNDENRQGKRHGYPKFFRKLFVIFIFRTEARLYGDQVHTTERTSTRFVLNNVRMHGASPLCWIRSGQVLLFHQIHSTNGALAGLVVGFFTFTMHGAIKYTRTFSFRFVLLFVPWVLVMRG